MAIRILSSENITGKLTLTGQQELLELTRGGASDSKWFFSADSVKLYIAEDTSASNNIKMTLTDAGNVGIGTLSPDQTGYGYKTLSIMGGTTAGYAGVLELLTPSTDANGQNLGIVSFGSGGTRNAMIGAVRQSGNNNAKLQFWTAAGANGIENRMTIDADGQVGIGTDDPDGKVHIFKGSNGATTVGTASDELILENDTDCGLTIRSAADATGVVSFASPTDHNVGQLYYNHDDDSMVIRTNDAIRTIIGSSGIMYIMGATASTNNSLQLQYNSTAGTAEIYSKSTGGNTTFEFYTSSSGTTTQKFNIGSSGDVKITTNGKFLQGVRNTSGTVIDMIGFGAGTDRLQIKGGTSGGAESIAFFDTAGQMATFYNSNLGIGTTSPSGKLEVAGGNTLGFRLSNLGNQAAYDQVRMTYTGYNSGAPTVTFMPLTTPGSGNAYTTFHFSNTNGINPSSNNNANVDIDGNLTIGNAKGLQETILTLRNYDANLASTNTIQASLRMSGRYWSGATSQLVETRINSVHQESDGNGGSALTFMTQTGGDGVVEQMRIDKVGNVGIGTTSVSGVKFQTVQTTSGEWTGGFKNYTANGYGLRVDMSNSSSVQSALQVYTGAGTGFVVKNTGNVGIGTESPAAALDIKHASAPLVTRSTNNNAIAMYNEISGGYSHLYLYQINGGAKVVLSSNGNSYFNGGNLGIGITNPAEKLHVNGRTILQNTEHSDYAAGSLNTTGVVVATVPSSTNGQSVMITFEATGGTGSVYSVIYSCYNGGGNWYYTKNVLIFGGNIEVAETNGSGSSTLSFSFRATSGSAAYTPRVVMKGSPYGLVSFI